MIALPTYKHDQPRWRCLRLVFGLAERIFWSIFHRSPDHSAARFSPAQLPRVCDILPGPLPAPPVGVAHPSLAETSRAMMSKGKKVCVKIRRPVSPGSPNHHQALGTLARAANGTLQNPTQPGTRSSHHSSMQASNHGGPSRNLPEPSGTPDHTVAVCKKQHLAFSCCGKTWVFSLGCPLSQPPKRVPSKNRAHT